MVTCLAQIKSSQVTLFGDWKFNLFFLQLSSLDENPTSVSRPGQYIIAAESGTVIYW